MAAVLWEEVALHWAALRAMNQAFRQDAATSEDTLQVHRIRRIYLLFTRQLPSGASRLPLLSGNSQIAYQGTKLLS